MTEVPMNELYDTSVTFMLHGIAEKHTFPVRMDEAQRIQSTLDASSTEPSGKKQFAVFETTNGWTVAVCLAMLEAVYVLIDPIDIAPTYEAADPMMVQCRFADPREVLTAAPSYADEIAAMAMDLDDAIEQHSVRFVSFRDEDGEWLYIAVEHLRLMQNSSALITEGQREIDDDMAGPEGTC